MPDVIAHRKTPLALPDDAPAAPTPPEPESARRRRPWLVATGIAVASAALTATLVLPSTGESTEVLAEVSDSAGADTCALPTALALAEGVAPAELCEPTPTSVVPDLRMR